MITIDLGKGCIAGIYNLNEWYSIIVKDSSARGTEQIYNVSFILSEARLFHLMLNKGISF